MTLDEVLFRLEYLEKWREIAVRPCLNDCHDEDKDLFSNDIDDIDQLSCRCLNVRKVMNEQYIPEKLSNENLALDDLLEIKTSTIPNGGKGLFYCPQQQQQQQQQSSSKTTNYYNNGSMMSHTNTMTNSPILKSETIICYYTGHRHNFFSQKYQVPDKSYLLNIAGDQFVDPLPLLSVKARYINDPLNETFVNCKFVPEPKNFRCSVVAIRDILPNEELFVSYGAIYWSQHSFPGTILHKS